MMIAILFALLISCAVMIATWAYAKKINNYSIVDSVWAYSFILIAAFYAVFFHAGSLRQYLMLACVGFWSLRLGTFLWRRIQSHHPKEDNRYVELRRQYGDHVASRFFWFFQYQAWSVVLLTTPFLFIAKNAEPTLGVIEWVGIAIWAVSFMGEALADHQAKEFKTDPKNAKRVCDSGLWKYSRHPNYFFESCIWWGYFVFALGSPNGIISIFCPLLMLLLLTKVTGVPLSEAQSLKNKGDVYREYQRKTSVFFPWFPKAMILVCLITAGNQALAAGTDRVAKIYEVGKTSADPVFIQKTHLETKDGITQSETSITDASGKVVLTENASFQGAKLIIQKIDQLQTSKHYEIEVKNDRVYFRQGDIKGTKVDNVRESEEGYFDNFVTGPVSEAFLGAHWKEILAGKPVESRFGVAEVRETVGFEFKMTGRRKIDGQDAVVISMKPSSMLVSMVVDPIELVLDAKGTHYLRFSGRTPLKHQVKGEWKPMDGEIIYLE